MPISSKDLETNDAILFLSWACPGPARPKERAMNELQVSSVTETSIVTLTMAAATRVRDLIQQENDPALGLRVFVAGGGCSGLQYEMTLDEEQEGDSVIVHEGVKIFVDEMSVGYLSGSEIDYVDSLMGAGFVVNNPNAVSAC
jgi:iron-sulfur cluster assembly accessory protein